MSAGTDAPGSAPPGDAPLERVVRFYESLRPADVARIGELYAPDARFEDPFNAVSGTRAIARIFEDMFARLDEPRFVVRERVGDGAQAFLVWDFEFAPRGRRGAARHTIRGATHLRFGADGRVTWHRDYWDAAGELYETLPVIGALMRWLRRRLAA